MDKPTIPTPRFRFQIRLLFRWYDFWIGAYIDTSNKTVYICLLPTIVIRISWWTETLNEQAVMEGWKQAVDYIREMNKLDKDPEKAIASAASIVTRD